MSKLDKVTETPIDTNVLQGRCSNSSRYLDEVWSSLHENIPKTSMAYKAPKGTTEILLKNKGISCIQDVSEKVNGISEGLSMSAQDILRTLSKNPQSLFKEVTDSVCSLASYGQRIAKGDFKSTLQDINKVTSDLRKSIEDYSAVSPRKQGQIIGHDFMPMFVPDIKFIIRDSRTLATTPELVQAAENLHQVDKDTLIERGVEISAARRAIDVDKDAGKSTLAFYDERIRKIYVAKEILHNNRWIANPSIEFSLKHEVGHVINEALGPKNGYLSDLQAFKAAFSRDLSLLTKDQLKVVRLEQGDTQENRNEVFAESYAHASGLPAIDTYSAKIKAHFPNCIKYVKELHDARTI